MKKIIVLFLLFSIPFLSIAQKRVKKGKNVSTEKISNASYEFMIISVFDAGELGFGKQKIKTPDVLEDPELRINALARPKKIKVFFDYGTGRPSAEQIKLNETPFRTLASVVNAAANYGWEVISSNIEHSQGIKIHYFYMKRDK